MLISALNTVLDVVENVHLYLHRDRLKVIDINDVVTSSQRAVSVNKTS